MSPSPNCASPAAAGDSPNASDRNSRTTGSFGTRSSAVRPSGGAPSRTVRYRNRSPREVASLRIIPSVRDSERISYARRWTYSRRKRSPAYTSRETPSAAKATSSFFASIRNSSSAGVGGRSVRTRTAGGSIGSRFRPVAGRLPIAYVVSHPPSAASRTRTRTTVPRTTPPSGTGPYSPKASSESPAATSHRVYRTPRPPGR